MHGESIDLESLLKSQRTIIADERELRETAELQRDHQREKNTTSESECFELRSTVSIQAEEITELIDSIQTLRKDRLKTEQILNDKDANARRAEEKLAVEKREALTENTTLTTKLKAQASRLEKLEDIRKAFADAYEKAPPYNIEPMRSAYELAKAATP